MTGARRLLERTEDPGLHGYLGFVARQRPLTSAEESALALRIRDGDGEAVDKLVNANLRFVIRFGERRLVAVAAWWILAAVREAIGEQVGSGAVLLLPGATQAG